MAPGNDEIGPNIRDFASFMLDRPRTHAELGEALHDLVARVRDTGKKGSLTLTVFVEPFEKDVERIVVNDEIRLRLPEHDRKPSMFFADRDGNLTRNDPNAIDFSNLADVNTSTGEVNFKEV